MKYKISKYCIEIENADDSVILFNAVTGGITRLETKIYNYIKTNSEIDCNLPYFELLKKEKYIVPYNQDEFKLLRYNELLAQQETNSLDTLTYVIAPTTACNFRCVYCFEHEQNVIAKPTDAIIENIAKFIKNQCEKYPNIKKLIVTWFGGEPMLCFPEIIKIGKILKESLSNLNIQLDSRIITNGVYLTKERVKLLKENCNLSSAQITMDGLCEEYCKKKQCVASEYDKVISNICAIWSEIYICIRLNVERANLNDIYKLADFLYGTLELKNKISLYFAMLRDYSKGELKGIEFFTPIEYQIEKRKFYNYLAEKQYIVSNNDTKISVPFHKLIYCNLSRAQNFAIGPHGELYKCEHHFGQPDKVIGDVENGIYYNNCFFEHACGTNDKMCANCNLYPVCQTNCPEIHNLVIRKGDRCLRYMSVLESVKNVVKLYCRNA